MKRYKTVEEFLAGTSYWHAELVQLRNVVLTTGLDECIKWGTPYYTYEGKNIVGIGAFKSYFGLWFMQGALLADKHQVLINAQEGKTKAQRQWRMSSAADIKPAIIKRYVKEACKLASSGQEILPDRKTKPVSVPPELNAALKSNRRASAAFSKLSRAQQRDYAAYITEAKRAETKIRRIEKILPMISEACGLNDRYRGK